MDRKVSIDNVLAKLDKNMSITNRCRDSIEQNFCPKKSLINILKAKSPGVLNQILDFEGTNESFVDTMKRELITLIGQFISKNQSNFVDELNDILLFLKETIRELLRALFEPQHAALGEIVALP